MERLRPWRGVRTIAPRPRTLAAAAARILAEDVRAAVAVAPVPPGRDPSRSLPLVHDHVDVAPEQVLLVWDPARRVLWRNASGTYVADHISSLRFELILADGRLVEPSAMGASDWTAVVAVRVRAFWCRRLSDRREEHNGVAGVPMKRRSRASGYALLAALLVGVLAATFALVVVGAVHALHLVEAADAAGWRCAQAEAAALRALAERMRWDPAPEGLVTGGTPDLREHWSASWIDATTSSSEWATQALADRVRGRFRPAA